MQWYVDSKSIISDSNKVDSQDDAHGKAQPEEVFNERDFDHDDIYADLDPPEPEAEPIQPVADHSNGRLSCH